MGNRYRQAGFTLVEILIVVVILGILAAIVIPQFTQASESAKASSLVSQLQTIRSQLQLYQIQHGGEYPDLSTADEWDPMIEPHSVNADGSLDFEATDPDFGPYLQQAPRNPFNNSTDVHQNDTSAGGLDGASATDGWVYNSVTGQVKAVVTQDQKDNLNLNDADVVVGAAGGG